MREWWLDRNPRDRLALVAGGLIAVLVLLWAVWLQPMRESRQDLEVRLILLQEEYQWLAARAPEVAARHRALEGRIAGGAPRAVDGSSLLGIVDVSARAAGLGAALQRVRPLERAVEVEMEAVRYAELMRWLITLEQGHGVGVANLGLDRTENAGMVNARLRLEPAGR